MLESGDKKQVHRPQYPVAERTANPETGPDADGREGAMPIAGGTDVLVQARMLSGEVPLVNIAGLAELKEVLTWRAASRLVPVSALPTWIGRSVDSAALSVAGYRL